MNTNFNNTKPVESIVMEINKTGFINTMRKSFDSPESVIKELAQNSRRAGATTISIAFDENAKSFSISDDGNGIADFQKLISPYQSDWDSKTDVESPFGIGFLSCILISDKLIVQSNGKMFSAHSESIRNYEPIDIYPCLTTSTTITLFGDSLSPLFAADYEKIFSGFDIPVIVNGRPMARTNALQIGQYVNTPSGMFFSNPSVKEACKSGMHRLSFPSIVVLYYQGFEVGIISSNDERYKTYSFDASKQSILHVDQTRYVAKAPDRTALQDESKAKAEIRIDIFAAIQRYIIGFHNLHGDEIILESYETLLKFKLLHLYNHMDRAPKYAFQYFTDYPINYFNDIGLNGFNRQTPLQHPSRELIEGKKMPVFLNYLDAPEDQSFRVNMYCWLKNGVQLFHHLDEKHWLFASTCSAVDLDIVGRELPAISQSNNGLNHDAVLCDHYVLKGDCGDVNVDSHAFLDVSEVIIPSQEFSTEVINQSHEFNNNDNFDSSYQQTCCDELDAWLKNVRQSNNPLALFLGLIDGKIKNFPSLWSKEFKVSIDASGSPSIEII